MRARTHTHKLTQCTYSSAHTDKQEHTCTWMHSSDMRTILHIQGREACLMKTVLMNFLLPTIHPYITGSNAAAEDEELLDDFSSPEKQTGHLTTQKPAGADAPPKALSRLKPAGALASVDSLATSLNRMQLSGTCSAFYLITVFTLDEKLTLHNTGVFTNRPFVHVSHCIAAHSALCPVCPHAMD